MSTVIPSDFFTKLDLPLNFTTKQDYMGVLKRMRSLPSDRMVLKELRRVCVDFPDYYLDTSEFRFVVALLQSMYRPDIATGELDLETIAIIFTLSDAAMRRRFGKTKST